MHANKTCRRHTFFAIEDVFDSFETRHSFLFDSSLRPEDIQFFDRRPTIPVVAKGTVEDSKTISQTDTADWRTRTIAQMSHFALMHLMVQLLVTPNPYKNPKLFDKSLHRQMTQPTKSLVVPSNVSFHIKPQALQ